MKVRAGYAACMRCAPLVLCVAPRVNGAVDGGAECSDAIFLLAAKGTVLVMM